MNMENVDRVDRSEFLWTAEEDLENNVRDRMIPISKEWVWRKKEEMLRAECPCS